tara:strand:- start:374 stop:979 length:606 start_codon:yes stop_codon:yes gene_type:complete
MPWNPSPITGTLRGWMTGQSASSSEGPFSYQPMATQIGLNYHIAATAVNTIFASLPIAKGTAADITSGFEDSFELAQQWTTANINQNSQDEKDWWRDLPDSTWLPAAASVVKYWTGGMMSPLPPPPGGGVGIANPILFPGATSPLNINIGKAFKTGNATNLCSLLNTAFVTHLTEVSGTWTGLAAAGTPPPPYVFPWVTLS